MKNKANNSIELTFPKFASVNDYSHFVVIANNLGKDIGKKLKYIEITRLIALELIKLGFDEDSFDDMPNYVALFYIGKRPTKKEIDLYVKKWTHQFKEEWL